MNKDCVSNKRQGAGNPQRPHLCVLRSHITHKCQPEATMTNNTSVDPLILYQSMSNIGDCCHCEALNVINDENEIKTLKNKIKIDYNLLTNIFTTSKRTKIKLIFSHFKTN